ncbi:hypothetical protein B0H14DRAFT_2820774 [Mycena olivaceomarginata]|nr:hypothetical protein B0H14DRAFT_2820774 [Mycena olivaceomarginata]
MDECAAKVHRRDIRAMISSAHGGSLLPSTSCIETAWRLKSLISILPVVDLGEGEVCLGAGFLPKRSRMRFTHAPVFVVSTLRGQQLNISSPKKMKTGPVVRELQAWAVEYVLGLTVPSQKQTDRERIECATHASEAEELGVEFDMTEDELPELHGKNISWRGKSSGSISRREVRHGSAGQEECCSQRLVPRKRCLISGSANMMMRSMGDGRDFCVDSTDSFEDKFIFEELGRISGGI